jgi:hypothetical protein
MLLVGICAGGIRQLVSLPRPNHGVVILVGSVAFADGRAGFRKFMIDRAWVPVASRHKALPRNFYLPRSSRRSARTTVLVLK